MIPCYVSGKGMHASATTWTFKTTVIQALEASGLGYDTRYRYYRRQFPDLDPEALARLICDPIEYYDKEWPAYYEARRERLSPERAATAFMLERDHRFRNEARAAVYCYDEAGFGSGVNTMRFLQAGKPIIGFYCPEAVSSPLNLSNVLQLELDYPGLVTLVPYRSVGQIPEAVLGWLRELPG